MFMVHPNKIEIQDWKTITPKRSQVLKGVLHRALHWDLLHLRELLIQYMSEAQFIVMNDKDNLLVQNVLVYGCWAVHRDVDNP